MADIKEKGKESQAEGDEQSGAADDTVINTVARTVGSAMGVVASGTAKVLKTVEGEGRREGKAKRQSPAGDKLSERRKANKKKKRAAHKRKLRRSSSKG